MPTVEVIAVLLGVAVIKLAVAPNPFTGGGYHIAGRGRSSVTSGVVEVDEVVNV